MAPRPLARAAASPSPAPGPGDLDRATEAAMVASRALLGVVAVSLQPVLDKVTVPQFRALVLLDTLGPSRTGALAERLGIHQSTFSRTADRLVAAGLVRRLPNPNSRREVLVSLTASGRRLVTRVMQRRTEHIRAALEPLTPQQRRTVLEGMQLLAVALDEPGYEAAAAQIGA
ncbi:MarR family winged helix-turn-helix transcriptional regulator [Spongisporangium articulatum]|uniref:MarR family winged helix-turn-helix transcriptional regulator n=1 Tax=Spongisporangium articulatum TaxID=3362603 RepID=A0ABW8AM16_9ACTN